MGRYVGRKFGVEVLLVSMGFIIFGTRNFKEREFLGEFRWAGIMKSTHRTRLQEKRNIEGAAWWQYFGVKKTFDKLRQHYYWVGYHGDVIEWCRHCMECMACKGPQNKTNGAMKQYNVGSPFERMAIDIAGPFPCSKRGNRYILVIADYFSKWTEAFALSNQETKTVAETLVEHVFRLFGVPLELHSDQGRNFESHVFKEICELLGVRKTRTTPLHPQSDGIVERFHRTLLNHLKMIVNKSQDN
uniref:RNA-directed DNA polymerase n=1 Tax=Xenopsylla cheopis TaxID=163159 RepID=A0A6M2DRM9_XENCH